MGEAIVVGTDGSETAQGAVAQAVRVARALGADLHIVTVYRRMPNPLVANAPDAAALLMAAVPDSEAESIVEEAAAAVRDDGLDVHTHAAPCNVMIVSTDRRRGR